LKIGVPWPVKPEQIKRIIHPLSQWQESLPLVCLPTEYKMPLPLEVAVMPRNSSDIGSEQPRVYVKDMLNTLVERYPDQDWYGIGNSDCVPIGDLGDEDFEVLAFHRTDIPEWKYFSTKSVVSEDVKNQIVILREEGLTEKKIARKLNRMEIPPPEGHQEWTYITLRNLSFEQGMVNFWGHDMFLFRKNAIDKIMEYLDAVDPIFGTGGFDQRFYLWCCSHLTITSVVNKLYHESHTSEWAVDDIEVKHNGGKLSSEEMEEYSQKVLPRSTQEVKNWVPHVVEDPLAFITNRQMAEATLQLASYVPYDVDLIVGIARSGLIPGSALSCHLHLPLMSVSDEGVVDVGSGARFKDVVGNPRKILVVDDTIFAGRTFKRVMPILRKEFPRAEFVKVAIYSTPQAKQFVDLFACELAEPHYLEWNFFNSAPGERSLFDMDGIFCHDIATIDDDDGVRYVHALRNAIPKYLPRRTPIRMIVTARLEKYRSITEEWLAKHRVKYQELVMGPWKTLAERNQPRAVSTFKSNTYKRVIYSELFVESCPIQAREIVEMTGKKVLCPIAERVFS
jgi:hypoxanthine phosphoribosyltransferase